MRFSRPPCFSVLGFSACRSDWSLLSFVVSGLGAVLWVPVSLSFLATAAIVGSVFRSHLLQIALAMASVMPGHVTKCPPRTDPLRGVDAALYGSMWSEGLTSQLIMCSSALKGYLVMLGRPNIVYMGFSVPSSSIIASLVLAVRVMAWYMPSTRCLYLLPLACVFAISLIKALRCGLLSLAATSSVRASASAFDVPVCVVYRHPLHTTVTEPPLRRFSSVWLSVPCVSAVICTSALADSSLKNSVQGPGAEHDSRTPILTSALQPVSHMWVPLPSPVPTHFDIVSKPEENGSVVSPGRGTCGCVASVAFSSVTAARLAAFVRALVSAASRSPRSRAVVVVSLSLVLFNCCISSIAVFKALVACSVFSSAVARSARSRMIVVVCCLLVLSTPCIFSCVLLRSSLVLSFALLYSIAALARSFGGGET